MEKKFRTNDTNRLFFDTFDKLKKPNWKIVEK